MKHRILIVEDDDLLARAFDRMLSSAGPVRRVRNEAGARAELADDGNRWDVIVCDVSCFADVADFMGALPVAVARSVIWVTGYPMDHERALAAKATGRPVLLKPVERTALQLIVGDVAMRRL